MFEDCVTAEGPDGAMAHLDAFWEGSGSKNVSDLQLSLLHTGTTGQYPFQFVTHESFFLYECDVIHFFFFKPNFLLHKHAKGYFFYHFSLYLCVFVCLCGCVVCCVFVWVSFVFCVCVGELCVCVCELCVVCLCG